MPIIFIPLLSIFSIVCGIKLTACNQKISNWVLCLVGNNIGVACSFGFGVRNEDVEEKNKVKCTLVKSWIQLKGEGAFQNLC